MNPYPKGSAEAQLEVWGAWGSVSELGFAARYTEAAAKLASANAAEDRFLWGPNETADHLDELAIPGSLRDAARAEPRRALAVARYTVANQGTGAYFRTVFESGDWPANPDSNGKPAKSAYQRAETLIRNVGTTLEKRDLERELDDLEITEAQRDRLRKLHDQIRAQP